MTSSQDTGWSLAEAVQRTTGSKNSDDNHTQCCTAVEQGRLVAFGRAHIEGDHEWMPPAVCKFLSNRDLTASNKDEPYFDILIYPVVDAPNAIDLLEGMSLKDAFWQFVLRDPEVQFLGSKAIKANPDLKRTHLEGWCYPAGCREWPLVFAHGELAGGRSQTSPIGYLEDRIPQEVQQAADTVSLRYNSLLALLRQGKLEAVGDPVRSRGTDIILSSIWSHRSYYFDANNGDVLQANGSIGSDWRDTRLTRWRAVMLRKPQRTNLFHVKPRVSDQLLSSPIEPQRQAIPRAKAMARVNTKVTSFNACREWLIRQMEASTRERESIGSLWKKAQEKWPNTLSYRSFLRARSEAIHFTRAYHWSAAGAPKKSLR
jgi:hypothetical protein